MKRPSRFLFIALALAGLLVSACGLPDNLSVSRRAAPLAVAPSWVLEIDLPGCEGLIEQLEGPEGFIEPLLLRHPADADMVVVVQADRPICIDSSEGVQKLLQDAGLLPDPTPLGLSGNAPPGQETRQEQSPGEGSTSSGEETSGSEGSPPPAGSQVLVAKPKCLIADDPIPVVQYLNVVQKGN